MTGEKERRASATSSWAVLGRSTMSDAFSSAEMPPAPPPAASAAGLLLPTPNVNAVPCTMVLCSGDCGDAGRLRRRVRFGDTGALGAVSSAALSCLRDGPRPAASATALRRMCSGTRTTFSVWRHSNDSACHTRTMPFTSADTMCAGPGADSSSWNTTPMTGCECPMSSRGRRRWPICGSSGSDMSSES